VVHVSLGHGEVGVEVRNWGGDRGKLTECLNTRKMETLIHVYMVVCVCVCMCDGLGVCAVMFIVYVRHKQVHEFYSKRNIGNVKCLNYMASMLGSVAVVGLLLVGSFQVSRDHTHTTSLPAQNHLYKELDIFILFLSLFLNIYSWPYVQVVHV